MKQCRIANNGRVTAASCAQHVLEVVHAVMRVIRQERRRKAAAEMSVVQFRAPALSDYRGGASVSEVAEHIGLTMPSASKLIDGLVRRGYLRRRPDPHDRRKTILAATARGARAVELARRTTAKHLSGMLESIPAERLGAIEEAMSALRTVFIDDQMRRVRSA